MISSQQDIPKESYDAKLFAFKRNYENHEEKLANLKNDHGQADVRVCIERNEENPELW